MGKKGKASQANRKRERGQRADHGDGIEAEAKEFMNNMRSFVDDESGVQESFPFGLGGPSVRVRGRRKKPLTLLIHVIWCLVAVTQLVFLGSGAWELFLGSAWYAGLGPYLREEGLMRSWLPPLWWWWWRCRAIHLCFVVVTLVLYMCQRPAVEAAFHFWALPMVHGLLCAAPLQICLGRGTRYPMEVVDMLAELDGEGSDDGTGQLFISNAFVLFAPAIILNVYAGMEHEFMAVSYYDLHKGLLGEHRIPNYVFHLTSPALLLALWWWGLSPRVYTDLQSVDGVLFLVVSALSNAIMLRIHAFSELGNIFGDVRWHPDGWVVWLVPILERSSKWSWL